MSKLPTQLDLNTISGIPDGTVTLRAKATSIGLEASDYSNDVQYNQADALNYELSEDESYYIVTGAKENRTVVNIPETYGDKPVKAIGDSAFSENLNITKVIIPKTVKSIGASAFDTCVNLTDLTISDDDITVYFINRCLWKGVSCWWIGTDGTYATYPGDPMRKIGTDENGYEIYKITVTKNLDLIKFSGKNINTDEYEFSQDITASKIPNHSAWCVSYNSIYAFRTNYTPDDIDSKILAIGGGAFADCKNLKTFRIPNTMKAIGNNMFANSGIETLTYSTSCMVETIGDSAFLKTPITILPAIPTLKTISLEAFYNCSNLTTVYLSENLVTIDEDAFASCINLANVILPVEKNPKLETIGHGAFFGCALLTQFIITEKVKFIGSLAFRASGVTFVPFFDQFGWYLKDPDDESIVKVVDYLELEEGNENISALNLKDLLTIYDWHKLEKVPAPELTLEGDILTIKDPVGFAESFKVYAGDTLVHSISLGGYNQG